MSTFLKGLGWAWLFSITTVFGQSLVSVSTNQLQFQTTSELGLDSLTLTLNNGSANAIDCRVVTFDIYEHKPFWTPDSVFILAAGAQRNIKVYFKPQHNILNNSELIIQTNSGFGALRVDLQGQGTYSRTYYASTQNTEGDALRTALNVRLASPYTQLGYSGTNNARLRMFGIIDNWKVNGREPSTPLPYKNECVYTGRTITYNVGDFNTGTLNNAPYQMNTEHTWPQSMGATNEPMQSDLHHLYISDGPVNSARGNKPFGWVPSPTLNYAGGSKANSTTFEPRDVHKAGVAVAMLYFSTRYFNNSSVSTSYMTASMENDLREWVKLFPPDSLLRNRNDGIESFQQNRNPYIDYPQFLDRMTQVRGTAAIPAIMRVYVSDTVVNLGQVSAGSNVTYRVVVVNNGTQPVQLSGIQVSGTGLSYTGSASQTIARGEAVVLELQYSGNGNPFSGNLQFGTNVPGAATFNIPVQAGVGASTLSAFSLLAPFDGLTYAIEGDSNVLINFRWQPVVANTPGQITYSFALENTATPSLPPILMRAGLQDTVLSLRVGEISRLLDSLNVQPNQVLACSWLVTASSGPLSRQANAARNISFRRGILSSVENQEQTLRLYPNPANDVLFLEAAGITERSQLQLRDLSGRSLPIVAETADGKIRLRVDGLAEGLYFAYLVTEGGLPRVLPFVIKR
ncbi:MAG: endonuclease [Sphingobacteriaceae bacterium]|nr:endonuclease [Sphingobacteriaceae bacterium]